MDHLSPEYLCLFNAVSDTIEQLQEMIEKLKNYQQKAEALYIESEN